MFQFYEPWVAVSVSVFAGQLLSGVADTAMCLTNRRDETARGSEIGWEEQFLWDEGH